MKQRLGGTTLMALLVALLIGGIGPAGPARAAATGSIAGTVTVPAGSSAAGIEVEIWRADGFGAMPDYSDLATSAIPSADGTYKASGVPAGQYYVRFRDGSGVLPTQYWNGTPRWDRASVITVGTTPVTGIDAHMPRGGSISGRVTVPAGVDVTKVWVHATSVDTREYIGGVQAAPDGTYILEGLSPGRYRVEFDGWSVGLVLQQWKGIEDQSGGTEITVDRSQVSGIDARMTKGATISGRIYSNSDCDLTGVAVWVMSPGMASPNAVVQPDGRWSVTGLATGSYRVEFSGREVGLPWAFWNGRGDPRGYSEVTLTAGRTTTGIDMRLDGPTDGCLSLRPYVEQVYRDLLKRDPDAGGLNSWVNALAFGAPLQEVANSITSSDEFRSRLLSATYKRYLGRGTDSAGLAYWLEQMRAGRTVEDVQAGFIASDEFYARSGATPKGWVVDLYRTVLDRTPSATEVQWWVDRIMSGMNRGTVARGFLYSNEHLTTVVDGFYVDLLHRHIDPVGRAHWVTLIQQGHREEEIVAGILSSAEYCARVGR